MINNEQEWILFTDVSNMFHLFHPRVDASLRIGDKRRVQQTQTYAD